jgi:RNA polymerase sigma-70 factor (ECF subfamily)
VDDTAKWKKITEGDGEAFGVLYRQCAPRLPIFLRHLLINEHTAEDVMQNTFTEIWHRPRGYDPGRGSLRAYLFGLARKQAVGWWRKQHPNRSSRSMI